MAEKHTDDAVEASNTIWDYLAARCVSLIPDLLCGFRDVHLSRNGEISVCEGGDWLNGSFTIVRCGRPTKVRYMSPDAIYRKGARVR